MQHEVYQCSRVGRRVRIVHVVNRGRVRGVGGNFSRPGKGGDCARVVLPMVRTAPPMIGCISETRVKSPD